MSGELNPLDVARELRFRRAKKDVFFFAEKLWTIQHPEKGRIPFEMRDPQINTMDAFLAERKVIILKARQIGFSTLVATYCFWLAYFHDDVQIVMLSKGEREAKELLDKVKYGFRAMPQWLKDRGPKNTNGKVDDLGTQSVIEFDNNSSIESLPSRSDPARGRSVTLVVVDEWAFLENPADAWASIEPIADIGGQVIGLSTANGAGTFYHQMWTKATTGSSEFHPIFYPWNAVPERNDDWYESKKNSLLPWQLAQEYPSDPEEAFIRSGNPVFDIDVLRAMPRRDPVCGELRPTSESTAEFVLKPNGNLQVWEYPVTAANSESPHTYCIGADVAEGLEHGDYSVAWVIDAKTGQAVAKWRGHVPPDIFGSKILKELGYFYNVALVGPEVNNHGFSTCVNLRDESYPHIYYRHSYDERTNKRGRKLGWRTQSNTKPLMIDELQKALREELVLEDPETFAELMTFVRAPDGKMHGSPHDDQVIALAIANQMRKHVFNPEYVRPQDTAGTVQSLIDGLIDGGASAPRQLAGRHNVRHRGSLLAR